MKTKTILFFLWPCIAAANTNPAPTIVSAAMHTNGTLMDVVYRVDDPDDATVKVRALAFIDGTRSFSRVIRPISFIGSTNLGDAIAANTNHTLTWDVGADWNTNVGQLKFEILCLDNRGLLEFDWISIPATNGQPALTISQNAPSTNKVLDALFWLYASGDPEVSLTNGVLLGTAASGVFGGVRLADGGVPQGYAVPYLFKRLNLDAANSAEVNYAQVTARAGLTNAGSWHAANRPYSGMSCIVGWGYNDYGQCNFTNGGWIDVTAIAAGYGQSLALMSNGTVIGWGQYGPAPANLSGITAIAAGDYHSLAITSNGRVVAWGLNTDGQTNVPSGLSNATAVAGGWTHSLAVRGDGTVIGWGNNNNQQINVPAGLSNVTAIGGGWAHSLALRSDGTIVGWGNNVDAYAPIPSGLSNVTAIAVGDRFNLALKSDGTVVAWGQNDFGQTNVPPGLSGVTAISAGHSHGMALTSNGVVVAWGRNFSGQINVPPGLTNVTGIAAGGGHSLALTHKAQ